MSVEFDDAATALLMTHPFFGTLLMKMEHIETTAVKTLGVNRYQLKYNPEFLKILDADERIFVVAHEVMHQAWQHFPRMEYYLHSGMGPDGQPLDWDLYNKAADYPINDALVKGKVGKPVPESKFKMCLDPQFPETMTPEEVYCVLAKQGGKSGSKPGGKSGPGTKQGDQQPLDEHDALEGADKPGAITPADVVQAANNHKAIRGEYPVGIDRLLGELKRPDVSPWSRLRNFITKALPGRDASSWKRLQRKYMVRGVGMPGPTGYSAGTVGVVVDTSGSIGEDMLNLFAGHLGAILTDAKPEKILVYWVDAAVHRIDTVKNATELRALMSKPVPGGGGTDMPKGVKRAEKDKCDAIVVLTDGYTPFCSAKKPLMWAITSHNIKADGNGETIHI